MPMQFREIWQQFENLISACGAIVEHSGQPNIAVFSVKAFYDADETACEEEWFNHRDQLVSCIGCQLTEQQANCSVEDLLAGEVDLRPAWMQNS